MLLPLEHNGMRGYLVRYLGTTGFKLAAIVDHDLKTARVLLWRATAQCWTKKPKRVELAQLASLAPDERAAKGKLLDVAFRAARHLNMRCYL